MELDLSALFPMQPSAEAQKQQALAEALRRQQGMGNLLQLTGDRVLAPFGQGLVAQADTQQQRGLQAALAAQRAQEERARYLAEDARRREEFGATQQWRREESKQRALDRAMQREFQAQQNALTREAAAGKTRMDKEEKLVQAAGKDLAPLAELGPDINYLADVVTQAEKSGGDVPGAGMWDSIKPAFLESADDTGVRQRAARVFNALLKETSGAGVTKSEEERKRKEYGLETGAKEAAFISGMKKLAADAQGVMQQRQARYPGQVLEEYRTRGGKLADTIQAQSPTGAPTPGPVQADPGRVRANELRALVQAGKMSLDDAVRAMRAEGLIREPGT